MTYNENQIKSLRPKTWGAWLGGTWTVICAYLKENAQRRFRELGADSDVSLCNSHTGGDPVDRIVESHGYSVVVAEFVVEYHIEYNR